MERLKPYQKKLLKNVCKNINIECTDNMIIKHIDKFYNYVTDSKNYVGTTARDILIILNLFLKNLNHIETAEIVYKKAKEYNNEYLKCELEQGLSKREQENYIQYNELLNKNQQLIDTYNNKPNINNMINLLILSLYVLQPPLRNNYNDMKIIYSYFDETDRKQNYLLIMDNQYTVIINNDKVSNKHPRKEIQIKNNILISILNIYFNQYANNNNYLFQNKNGTPYTKRQIQYIINKYFQNVNKILNIHNLRSAYITHFYKNNHSLKSKNELASQMRHTQQTSELIYCKMI
jgi:hypothetical protein